MFNGIRIASSITRAQVRLNSTKIPNNVISTIPKPTPIFPKISDIRAEEVFGAKPFGGGHPAYFIKRSKYGHLPVYLTIKSKAAYTEIRKLSGNVIQLRTDLIKLLPKIPAKEFKIVQQSQKIIIKGNHVDLIKGVLSEVC